MIQPMPQFMRSNSNGKLAPIRTMSATQATKQRSRFHWGEIAAKMRFMTAILRLQPPRSLPVTAEPPPIREETFAPIPDTFPRVADRRIS